MEYQIIRSRRRTVSLQLKPEGLIVRAPRWMSAREIDRFVAEHSSWIEKHSARVEAARQAAGAPLTPDEIRQLTIQAKRTIAERVAFYAPAVGVSYGRITIRCQRTLWGSCSAKGNLNFNCLLMLTPPEVLDSVVVHELCHRKEMNHSKRFYAEVLRVFPEYHRWHGWLKENGGAIMARVRQGE